MRLFLALCLLHLAAGTTKPKNQSIEENCTSIPAKYPSRRDNGRPIQQLIGGQHVALAHETLRNMKNINNIRHLPTVRKKYAQNNRFISGLFMITASTGNRRNDEDMTNYTKKKEERKTLSSQVAEGKYGLIHNELFKTLPKRPGILSYKFNSDVPNDDIRNFGGLQDKEIWLSENYLVVLKGGYINENSHTPKWMPIDDYNAPARPVKISSNPKVPPPFPVQLTDNGPIQYIGNNKPLSYNPFTNQTVFLFSNERVPHIKADDLNNKKKISKANGSPPQFNGYQYPPPAPLPHSNLNQTFSNPFLNLPLPIPASIDEQNNTYIDEDDPSLYYPPPYSFEYKSNYKNPVSPGPLVPGIILPPPPSFFAALDDKKDLNKQPIGMSNSSIRIDRLNDTISETVGEQYISKKTVKFEPVTVETPNYKIEIEKINVKKFPDKNNKSPVFFGTTTPPSIKNDRNKPSRITQLHKINPTVSQPLISLNPENFSGNPIYFEYFDARIPFFEYPMTSPRPTPAIENKDYNFQHKKKIATSQSKPFENDEQYTSKALLPVQNEGLYLVPGSENYRYKTIQEFNRQIEKIKQTLKLYENSVLESTSIRTSKGQSPIYNLSFDQKASIPPPVESQLSSLHVNPLSNHHVQLIQRPYLRHSTESQQKPSATRVMNQDPYNYYYKDYTKNAEVTSASLSEYTSFTTANPFYIRQPNWNSFDKTSIHEILKPSIYNNGASGYNPELYVPAKSFHGASILCLDRSNQQDVQQKHISHNQEGNQKHLGRDIIINYKHPLPIIHQESEFLPYRRRITKQTNDYQLSST